MADRKGRGEAWPVARHVGPTLKNYCGYDSFFLSPPELLSSSFFPMAMIDQHRRNSGVASLASSEKNSERYLLGLLSSTRLHLRIFYSFNAIKRMIVRIFYIYACIYRLILSILVRPIILIHEIPSHLILGHSSRY